MERRLKKQRGRESFLPPSAAVPPSRMLPFSKEKRSIRQVSGGYRAGIGAGQGRTNAGQGEDRAAPGKWGAAAGSTRKGRPGGTVLRKPICIGTCRRGLVAIPFPRRPVGFYPRTGLKQRCDRCRRKKDINRTEGCQRLAETACQIAARITSRAASVIFRSR